MCVYVVFANVSGSFSFWLPTMSLLLSTVSTTTPAPSVSHHTLLTLSDAALYSDQIG